MKLDIKEKIEKNVNKKVFGVSSKHFTIYVSIFSLGIIAFLLTFLFYNSIFDFWQQMLVSLTSGLIVTSIFAYLIDYANNFNYTQKIKLKRINILSKLNQKLKYYINGIVDYVKNFNNVLELTKLNEVEIKNPKIVFSKLIEMYEDSRNNISKVNFDEEKETFLNFLKMILGNTNSIKIEI
ncbi:MAG: hypothetical protein PHX09_03980, partial [Clostridia bacterium]|nr:hypothetical protein [Clostridia bacterium]